MKPKIRYFILCDDVRTDPANFLRLDVVGLIVNMRPKGDPAFPFVRPLFCTLVVLTGCRGEDELFIRIIQAKTGKIVFRNEARHVKFSGSPRDALGIVFKIGNCSFPAKGVYWVELFFSGSVIARKPLRLLARGDQK
jgi:hypothetical protein